MINKLTIAIDFDDTITHPSPFPNMGKVREDAVNVIKALKKKYNLILWTCREGEWLQEALDELKKHDIEFDYVNECPQGTRKVVADYYIDDRAFGGCIDWKIISEKLL